MLLFFIPTEESTTAIPLYILFWTIFIKKISFNIFFNKIKNF